MTGEVRWRRRDAGVLFCVAAAAFALAQWAGGRLDYHWDWRVALEFVAHRDGDGEWQTGIVAEGFLATVRLTLWGAALAGAGGIAMGIARASRFAAARALSGCYVEVVRNTPPIVFMLVFYFFISAQVMPHLGVGALAEWMGDSAFWVAVVGPPALLENFMSGLLCLAMFEAAFAAEIVRGGILSVGDRQREAAAALGMRPGLAMRLVVLPQALRKATPPLAGQLAALIKDSAVISVISVQELTFAGLEAANSTGRIFEMMVIVAALYFVLCRPLTGLFRMLEKRTAID